MENEQGAEVQTAVQEQPQLAAVQNLDKARKAKKKREKNSLAIFAPVARSLQGDTHEISACDGQQTYLWVLSKRKGDKTFTVREIYPGLIRKHTRIRDVKEATDLVLEGRFTDVEDALEELYEVLFEGLDVDVEPAS